jgi:hypothetical protein
MQHHVMHVDLALLPNFLDFYKSISCGLAGMAFRFTKNITSGSFRGYKLRRK